MYMHGGRWEIEQGEQNKRIKKKKKEKILIGAILNQLSALICSWIYSAGFGGQKANHSFNNRLMAPAEFFGVAKESLGWGLWQSHAEMYNCSNTFK